mmetsp:Transcript_29648/g.64712  ORF Transcript_29648/g.64712 Transcript_29648/m.64712 type:complete len:357 (-) Transcript_29648:258-1328(-)|eukprot:CAMPEP_0118939522 /NCGR_PEP_ID=MMETSP1169-20130426/29145_1 /TAXON_ID=36882 /ORGANISM="Pyramimonas obovata, Strain CCMP722" /LENGTH=356 /DNA_ID=CAMNT_0006883815 /DNA_START=131 /DNA_END=1201 /DNA_ORIENTATION=+
MGLSGDLLDLIVAVFATGRTRRNYHARQLKKRSAFKQKGSIAKIFSWFKLLFLCSLVAAFVGWAVDTSITLSPLDEKGNVLTDFQMMMRKFGVLYRMVTYQDRPQHKPVSHEDMHGAKSERVMSREKYGEMLGRIGELRTSTHNSKVHWRGWHKGDDLTVELFVTSNCREADACAKTFNEVMEAFPSGAVHTVVHHIGGGPSRDQTIKCRECADNTAAVCAQQHLKSTPVLKVLACQATHPGSALGRCLVEVGASDEEIEAIQRCSETEEGRRLYKLSASYASLVMPNVNFRRSCSVRIIDSEGAEKQMCAHVSGRWEPECGGNASTKEWKKAICRHLGDRAYKEKVCTSILSVGE